ncbi:MAG: gamma carbonic anhydrase family protein [Brevinematia bacterium]
MVLGFNSMFPRIHDNVYLSYNASVIGDVEIQEDSSVWFGAVLRGDVSYIRIGRGSNVQDNAVIHVNYDLPTLIGDYVTIGHSAVVHGAIISDYVIVGMGSIVLDGAKIGSNVIIGAGSVVPPKMIIPDGVLVLGIPAKIVRNLLQEEIEHIKKNALDYISLSKKMEK